MTTLARFFGAFDKTDLCVLVGVFLVVFFVLRFKQTWNYDHFWQNLDKFILLFLFLVSVLAVIHVLHHGGDASMMSWIQNTAGQILSALLAILGARAIAARKTEGNGNTEPPKQETPQGQP